MADKIFVGHMGEKSTASLAAVGTSSLIILFTLTILLTTLIGTIIIILRYIGAGQHESASHYSAQSLVASLSVGLGVGLLWYLGAARIFDLLGAPDDVKMIGVRYFRILGLFSPIIVINFMATGLLRSSGDTARSMTANMTMVAVNILGDYVLIFGKWGFPRMEASGAALASGIANSIALIISASFLFSGKAIIKLSPRHFLDFRIATFRRILGKGIPVTTEQLITTGAYLVVVRYSMRLGGVPAAAHQAIISFGWISSMCYQGVGITVTALTGKSLGANEKGAAERTGYVAWVFSTAVALVFGAVLFFSSRGIMRIFLTSRGADNLEAIRIGAKCLKIVAFIQIPKAMNTVFASSLRGAGDLRWLIFTNTAGTSVGELILGRMLGLGTTGFAGIGLAGLWIGNGVGESIKAIMNYRRYRKGRWKNIAV